MKLSIALCLAFVAPLTFANGPGKNSDFDGRRVLFIGIDDGIPSRRNLN
jgi:hypothetical protein